MRVGHFYIDRTCIGCGACEHACPGKVDAIYKIDGDFTGRFAIILENCIDCGFCIPVCPVNCIHDGRTEGINTDTESGWKKIEELQAWASKRPALSSSPTPWRTKSAAAAAPKSTDEGPTG